MFLRKLTDQFTDLYDLFWIKSDTWFIKNNDLRESKHCLCQSDSLAVSFRQILDQTVFYFPDLHHLLYFIDGLFSFILGDSFQLRYKFQIFTDCHLHVQWWQFRQITDLLFRLLRFFQNIISIDQYFSFGSTEVSCHNIHRC